MTREQAQAAARRSAVKLTKRQEQVAILLSRGMSLREAAGEIGIAVRTAGVHADLAYKKLRCHNRAQLTRRVLDLRIDRGQRLAGSADG